MKRSFNDRPHAAHRQVPGDPGRGRPPRQHIADLRALRGAGLHPPPSALCSARASTLCCLLGAGLHPLLSARRGSPTCARRGSPTPPKPPTEGLPNQPASHPQSTCQPSPINLPAIPNHAAPGTIPTIPLASCRPRSTFVKARIAGRPTCRTQFPPRADTPSDRGCSSWLRIAGQTVALRAAEPS